MFVCRYFTGGQVACAQGGHICKYVYIKKKKKKNISINNPFIYLYFQKLPQARPAWAPSQHFVILSVTQVLIP